MPNQAQLLAIKGGGLIDVIREKPPLYIGERSLSALYYFLQGYVTGLRFYDIEAPHPLPSDFHEWVAYRLHFFESTSGYRNMILRRVPDESAALDRFFGLLAPSLPSWMQVLLIVFSKQIWRSCPRK